MHNFLAKNPFNTSMLAHVPRHTKDVKMVPVAILRGAYN